KKYQTRSQRLYYQFVSGREKKSITHADAVCCVSNFVAQYLEKIYGFSDGKVIYNGIDLDFFTPKDDSLKDKWENNNDICTLFFAGNQRIMKGYDLLPKIMKELGEGFQLKIATGLRSKNKTINQDHIHELGLINPNNMPNIYRSAEIYLFPSRLEGFGLSVAEAMACGKPVIATNCSSLPELVIDGKGGFLCEMDNIKDFAESVRIIAEDASLRREMGRFNRERAIKNFSLDRMVNEYVKVYKNL
ncbi:MAG: glycosyltransferase family 4 protein, partial [Methanomicrobiales archaeon]|nr:glycosyltransferase family 4 protein [Methanomicrobiales archaeon]